MLGAWHGMHGSMRASPFICPLFTHIYHTYADSGACNTHTHTLVRARACTARCRCILVSRCPRTIIHVRMLCNCYDMLLPYVWYARVARAQRALHKRMGLRSTIAFLMARACQRAVNC